MSYNCPLCDKGDPLYKCPKCGVTAHINKKTKGIVIHLPEFKPSKPEPFKPAVTHTFPTHFDCPLALPVDRIDLDKLVKVEAKKS